MEANGQTLYNDDLLNILPDGVIILDINREVIQLNQQAFTELHVHSSVNAMMPLPTNKIFKLLNKKEDIRCLNIHLCRNKLTIHNSR